MSMNFQLLIKTKLMMLKIKLFLALKLLDLIFIMLINVKMPTSVGILTFMSWIDSMLRLVENEKIYNLVA